ncbi:enoyl-CoA hydratase/isomerase family protein [Streptomyces griseus]|uniref:enoyl-CoA hydratase/isomerase family protein n=1 Tax=Streptomyces griseus TaxID=1911 RepID=UPI0037AEC301
MPETGICFVPDVGGTCLLALAPGEPGAHLALTGAAVGAADALLCGLADHFVPADRLDRLVEDLARTSGHEALAAHVGQAPPGELAGHRERIDHCHAAGTVEEIADRLVASGVPAAKEAAAARAAHDAAGHRALDAPVSGGVVGAEATTLTFLAGGGEAGFHEAEPLLAAMGKRAVHCGGTGAGQAAKICNNMILSIAMSRLLDAATLESLGYNIALYPVTFFRLAMGAVEDGLRTLAAGGTQESLLPRMQTRSRLYEVLGSEDYSTFDSAVFDFTLPPGN